MPFFALMALAACGGGGGGSAPGAGTESPPAPRTDIVSTRIIDSSGGSVAVTDETSPIAGTQVVIPPGALSNPTLISIGQVSGATGLPADASVVELSPTGIVFAVPVAVTMRYSPQYLAFNGISDPTTLKIVAMQSGSATETLRTVSQDTAQNTITVNTTHFGSFGVVGYTLASLSGDYAMNFTMIDARFGAPVQLDVNVPSTPYTGLLDVPFPGYGFRAEQGTVTFDGAGNYSWTAVRNVGGTATPVGGSGTYTVAADGTFTLDFGVVGSVLGGGSAFILAATAGVPVIEMGMGIKKGGTVNASSLDGNYSLALYYSDAPDGVASRLTLDVPRTPYDAIIDVPFPGSVLNSELRNVTFDGAGNYSWTGTRNTGGIAAAVSGSGTYTVDTDGTLSLEGGSTRGSVLAGGDMFIVATGSGQPVSVGVGLKKSRALNTASLAGRYMVALHYSDPGSRPTSTISLSITDTPYVESFALPFPQFAFNSEVRTMIFDGAGSYAWSGTRNHGGIAEGVSGSGTYAVADDGTLTLDSRFAGSVLAGGSTFSIVSTSGQIVEIGVGILR
ncbi:MAG: hypothetical protein ABI619_08800 [Betaproteobacteria bacterium]